MRDAPSCPVCDATEGGGCGHLLVRIDRNFLEFEGDAYDTHVVPAIDALEVAVKEHLRRTQEAAAEWIDKYAGRFPDSRIIPAENLSG